MRLPFAIVSAACAAALGLSANAATVRTATENFVTSRISDAMSRVPGTVSNIVTKTYVEGLGVSGGVTPEMLTNYTDSAVAAAESRITNSLPRCETAAAAWQVPNDWRLGYLLRTTQESGHFDSFTTNAYFQIFSNVTETASTTLAAVLAPVALDRLSGFAPTGVTYSAVSPGVTIAGNVATAPTGGVFRIRAADPVSGQARYADIPLDHRTRTGETVEYYFADAANQQ